MRLFILLTLLLAAPLLAPAQRRAAPAAPAPRPEFLRYLHSPWVDSLMRVLTPRERVAQLFMVAAYSNRQAIDDDSVSRLVQQYGVGGLIWFQGGPARQTRLLNRFQGQARVPLLVAMDGEWGAGMRLDSVPKFPFQMALGAVPAADSALLYDMGREVARQFRRLGMHVNFAPVIDVNNNPLNPVIGFRSFGERPAAVARAGRQYMRGMQEAGILAVAKHFPGHGDVTADSHLALPLVTASRARLDTLELPPFRALINAGVGGVMVAHLHVPALDTTAGPSTLSRPIVQGLLQDELGFKGLVFTDAMNMKGVISQYPPGEADVRALLAGNDILEFSKNVPLALQAVQAALDSGRLARSAVDEHCRRVLALKQWAGLRRYRPLNPQNLAADLNPPHALALAQRLTARSLTLLNNQPTGPAPAPGTALAPALPLRELAGLRLATLVLGGNPADTTAFQARVADYAPAAHFHLKAAPAAAELPALLARLAPYRTVLLALQGLGRQPSTGFGLTAETTALLAALAAGPGRQVVISVFGTAYAVARLQPLPGAVVLAYQEGPNAQQQSAQVIFGAEAGRSPVVGRLPVSVAPGLPAGSGQASPGSLRLRFAAPEEVGVDARLEARVDSLVGRALAAQATPGCQVVVARRGAVVLQKSYGNHTYAGFDAALNEELGMKNEELRASRKARRRQKRLAAAAAANPVNSSFLIPNSSLSVPRPVRNTDLYDLASLTKVLAATPALMQLQAAGKFSPDSTLGQYFSELRGTDKAGLKLRDVLAHQARLPAFIPFWQALTRPGGALRRRYFRPDSSARFSLPAATGLWARRDLPARVVQAIGQAPLNAKPGYVYSDLSFYLYPELVRRRTGLAFEAYLQREVYGPLGATTLGFRPRQRFPLARLVPTEYDSAFRRQLLHGTVNDEGAALLGGVSGHAGLFGSALDVAKVAQCYAWGGRYGNQQIFEEKVLAEYTRGQFLASGNRRGLGFDRPAVPAAANTARGASARSFGHSGFTGTYFWVDPVSELVVVVLTNRVHPSRHNNRLSELNLRTDIQQAAIGCLR